MTLPSIFGTVPFMFTHSVSTLLAEHFADRGIYHCHSDEHGSLWMLPGIERGVLLRAGRPPLYVDPIAEGESLDAYRSRVNGSTPTAQDDETLDRE